MRNRQRYSEKKPMFDLNVLMYTFALTILFLIGACSGADSTQRPGETKPVEEGATLILTPVEIDPPSPDSDVNTRTKYGFTHQNSDGNRWVEGSGSVPDVEPVRIQLSGTPEWLVGAPFRQGSLWVVTMLDGRVESYYLEDGHAQPVVLSTRVIPAGAPPLLQIQGNLARLIEAEDSEASQPTHPIITDESGAMAYTTTQGDLVVLQGDDRSALPINALPDARILSDREGRILLLAGATDRYGHGVVGDGLEASEIRLVDVRAGIIELQRIVIQPPKVVEGLMPIWADLDGDGEREIIVTTSDSEVGARFEVFDEAGSLVTTSEPIGLGFRWRHQLAVAPFSADGELELATVRTPHIGGIVEFFRLSEGQLIKVAELRGYTSHVIGSRNLDMAVAGDFDGDGRVELLLPDQSLGTLGAIRRSEHGAEVVWSLDLSGELSTNLAAVVFENGSLALGAATQNQQLWLWSP